MAERNEHLREQLARAMRPEVDWSRYNKPFGELKGTSPEDTPAVFKTKTGVRITEGDIQRGIDVGMGAATVGGPSKGIKAYHSSPHDFDKFDISKIGTGEGVQMYGHGLYFAENPAVSGQGGQYWNQFRRRFDIPERNAALTLSLNKFDREAAIAEAQAKIVDPRMHHSPASMERARQELALLQSGKPVGPRTYEVSINADPRQMLDWDKPMGAQSGHVVDAMRLKLQEINDASFAARQKLLRRGTDFMGRPYSAEKLEQLRQPAASIDAVPGSEAYKQMGLPATDRQGAYVQATDRLREAGVPGIRYLDEGSRGAPSALQYKVSRPYADHTSLFRRGDQNWYVTPGGGVVGGKEYGPFKTMEEAQAVRASEPWKTSNYVVFDPNRVAIEKKYGIAAGLPTAGAAAAAAAASGDEDRM